jgi:hypothetical protein
MCQCQSLTKAFIHPLGRPLNKPYFCETWVSLGGVRQDLCDVLQVRRQVLEFQREPTASIFRERMEAGGSSETSVSIYKSTRYHNPGDCNLFIPTYLPYLRTSKIYFNRKLIIMMMMIIQFSFICVPTQQPKDQLPTIIVIVVVVVVVIGGQRGSMWPRGHTSCWGMCTIKTRVMPSIPTKSDACTSMLWLLDNVFTAKSCKGEKRVPDAFKLGPTS